MTTIVPKSQRRSTKKPRSVRINTAALTDEEMESLAEYLKKDKNIEAVEIERLEMTVPPPSHKPLKSPSGKPVTYFLTIEASAEPLILVVQFVQAHWDLVRGAGEAVPVLGVAYGMADYLIKKIKAFNKNRRDKIEFTPLYDAKGEVIKFVKKDKPKKR